MSENETIMDYATVDRYIERLIRAEKRNWGKGATTEIPNIDLSEIDNEDTRRQVNNNKLLQIIP